jgi:hypothetical protein
MRTVPKQRCLKRARSSQENFAKAPEPDGQTNIKENAVQGVFGVFKKRVDPQCQTGKSWEDIRQVKKHETGHGFLVSVA